MAFFRIDFLFFENCFCESSEPVCTKWFPLLDFKLPTNFIQSSQNFPQISIKFIFNCVLTSLLGTFLLLLYAQGNARPLGTFLQKLVFQNLCLLSSPSWWAFLKFNEVDKPLSALLCASLRTLINFIKFFCYDRPTFNLFLLTQMLQGSINLLIRISLPLHSIYSL